MARPLRVLLVEDDANDAELVLRALRADGRDIAARRVDTAAALTDALADGPWDVCLADFGLPGWNARAALAVVREVRPRLPFIVVSGTIGEETAVAVMREGADDYVLKSSLTRLPAAVDHAVRTNAELAAAAARLKLLESAVEQASDVIVVMAFQPPLYPVEYVNRSFTEMFGHGLAESVGRPVDEIMAADRPDVEGRRLADAVAHGTSATFSTTVRAADGSRRTVEGYVSPVLDSAGGIAHVVAGCRDVTDRDRARQRLKILEAAIDQAKDIIVVTSVGSGSSLVEYANAAAGRSLGRNPAELVGREAAAFIGSVVDAGDVPRVAAAITVGPAAGEARVRAPDGSIRILDGDVTAIHDETGKPAHMVSIVRDVTERKQAEEALRFAATHDRLTGLWIRSAVHEEIARAIDSLNGRSFAVVHVDLQRFREVNEAYGYDLGDEILKQIGPRLSRALGAETWIARLGGDEFIAPLLDIGDFVGITRAAQRAASALREPFKLGEIVVELEPTLGAALFPDHGRTADELLQHAQCAVEVGDRQGTTFTLYAEADDPRSAESLELSQDLRAAINANQLRLVYQPKVRVTTKELVGVEALVRWTHPTLGELPPARFIPLAERSGLIRSLAECVLGEALRQTRRWQRSGYPIPMAVNISARNLRDPLFIETVDQLVRSSGVPVELLTLELTESALMTDRVQTLDALNVLRTHRIGLAIDDFGTGYSSLAYLDRLPVQEMKLDRTFVHGVAGHPRHASIVAATVGLGRAFGISVVAEGVEDEADLARLQELGCDVVQGYLVSRPVAAAEISEALAGGVWRIPRADVTQDDAARMADART